MTVQDIADKKLSTTGNDYLLMEQSRKRERVWETAPVRDRGIRGNPWRAGLGPGAGGKRRLI